MNDRPNDKAQRGRLGRWLPAKSSVPLLRAGHGRSDMVIVGSGLALAIGCALFPWYVFFNQEKFGVQAMNFSGNEAGTTMPSDLVYPPELVRRELNPGEKRKVEFSLVHVANGRAMIEDEDGLWVVQKGSTLPDASKVASIEKRDGVWVLVTDANRVIQMAH